MADTELKLIIKADGSLAVRELGEVRSSVDHVGGALGGSARQAELFSSALKLIGGVTSAISLRSLATDILAVNREMETLRTTLISVEGSNASGARAFDKIQKFAADTPFEIKGLTEAYIKLKNFGIEPTNEVMQAITDQSSKLGASTETLSGITLALGQAWSKGKLQGEEINQLVERGVPVWDMLAQVTGKNTSELADMSVKGELTLDVISKLITKMGELSSGSNARAMDTLNGKISNLSDAWHTFEDTLLGDKSEGFIKSIVSSVTGSINLLTRNMSDSIDNQLAHAQARIDTYNKMNSVAKGATNTIGFIGSFGQHFGIGEEVEKVQSLTQLKAKQDAANAEVDMKKTSAAAIAQTDDWLAETEVKNTVKRKAAKTDEQKSVESLEKAEKKRSEAVREIIDNLNFEISIAGKSAEQQKLMAEIRTATARATADESKEIEGKIRALDKEATAQKRQQAMWDERVKQANEAYDLKKSNADLIKTGDVQGGFDAALANTQDNLAAGTITADEAKIEFDKLGTAYNDYFIDPAKKSTNELSEYAVQAARNMESAFADFLFDPFKNGAEGMAVSFLTTLKRMAADAAAANIMEGLFGSPGHNGQQGLTGGLVGGLAKEAGGALSGLFSGGGGFDGSGALQSFGGSESWISSLFSGYANGGDHPGGFRIVGERGPELEATGPSRIFNAEQTKDMLAGKDNGKSGHTVNINISMSPGNAPDKKSASNLAYQIGSETKRALARNG